MRRRVTVLIGLVSIAGLVLMQSPASAGHGDISVPIDTVIRAGQGEVVQLVSVPVDPELVGATCDWEFHATNQESVNPGNDLILSTGGTETVIPGVEDAPNLILDVTGSVDLGETLTVSVRLGPNGVFSGGLSVEVICGDIVPSTTSTTAAPVTTTTAAPVTTTTAAPVTTTTTAPTSTTAEVVVAGQVTTAPALAATGPSSSSGPLVGFAVLLLLGGAGLSILGTRARS